MYAYCLFCSDFKRRKLSTEIQQMMGVEVIAPKIIQRRWIKGVSVEEPHDFLPGYLFLYSEQPITDFGPLFRMEDVFRVLGEADQGYRLLGTDFAFAEMLRRSKGTLGVLKIIREGDKVHMADGTMDGVDGEVIRLDRRGRALVRFSFDGANIQSWVAVEMIAGHVEFVETTERHST